MMFILRSLLLLVGMGLVLLSALLGWSLLVGWVLTQVVSLSLFEGALLALVASGFVGQFITSFLAATRSREEEFDEEEYGSAYEIAETRFYKDPSERTWGAWFRFHVANILFSELRYSETSTLKTMDAPQMQELAIRLSEIGLAAIRHKSPQMRRMTITLSDLKQQMARMEMKPYDDPILLSAVNAVNVVITLPHMEEIFRRKLWDELTPY